jgi:hypothetical protein
VYRKNEKFVLWMFAIVCVRTNLLTHFRCTSQFRKGTIIAVAGEDSGRTVLWLAKVASAVESADASWQVLWFDLVDESTNTYTLLDSQDIVYRDSVIGELRGHQWHSNKRLVCSVPDDVMEDLRLELPDFRPQRRVVNLHEPATPIQTQTYLSIADLRDQLLLLTPFAQNVRTLLRLHIRARNIVVILAQRTWIL